MWKMYDDELHSNCGNVVYLAWNFFTNKILNRESLTSPTKSQQNEKQNIKENLTHTQLQTHQEHKNMKGWISRKNYILLAHSFHTHACILYTLHTHKRERDATRSSFRFCWFVWSVHLCVPKVYVILCSFHSHFFPLLFVVVFFLQKCSLVAFACNTK